MKPEQSPVCWGLTAGLLLAWSTNVAVADVASCRAALFRAHQAYVSDITKAKAKEARGRLTGRPVANGVTAGKIIAARSKADRLISAGCGDVPTPQEADPNICPGKTDFHECLGDFVVKADAITKSVETKVLRDCSSSPTCGDDGLPQCVSEDNCYCHETAEGGVDCIGWFACEGAQQCYSSSECPPGNACYVNTCCLPFGVCGPTACDPGGGTALEGRVSSTPE